MYAVYGLASSIANIYKLSAKFCGNEVIRRAEDLKPHYLKFIDEYYNHPPINRDNQYVVTDPKQSKALLKFYSASQLNDLSQDDIVGDLYEHSRHRSLIERIAKAAQELQIRNTEIATLFSLAIHSIVVSDSKRNKDGLKAYGGSTSNLVGLVWLTLKDSLSNQDIVELLIHELTHTLVFLDELNFGHFNYENITKREFWARSTILNRPRPIDKVVHSIVVGGEILNARQSFLPNTEVLTVHPQSELLKANALASIESVLSLPNVKKICLPRSLEIVEEYRSKIIKF